MMHHPAAPTFLDYIEKGDKVERIYRVLLSIRERERSWYRIANDAEVAYGWAHKVLKDLEKAELICGRRVIDPRGLFIRWAERRDRRLFREYNVQDPESVITESGLDHAYTGYFAENQLGQYLFPRFREIYIRKEEAAKWHDLLTQHGYVGKGNVSIILADRHVFFERQCVNNHSLVSTQQIIADLYRTGAECTEAADLLVSRAY